MRTLVSFWMRGSSQPLFISCILTLEGKCLAPMAKSSLSNQPLNSVMDCIIVLGHMA